LQAHEKEPCEREAQALKDTYYSELRKYKKTPQYQQYQDYLVEFKAKHSGDASQQQQGPDHKKSKLRQEASGLSRTYDDSVVDGDEGADGLDGADGDDGMDGVENSYNQPQSPSDRARPSPTNSPTNLERYRLFPIPRAPQESATTSSYSNWRSKQPSLPAASLHHYTTKSTLSSDQDSRSPASSHPAPSTAPTISPKNASNPAPTSTPAALRSTLHSSAVNQPAPTANTTLPSINSLASIATRKSSDTPLLNWPLHTTLPLLDPRAMPQRSTPDSLYTSPRMHQVNQAGPSLRSPPWLPVQDQSDNNHKNKTSLSTLLRATEHVERDDSNRSKDSSHKR
jgi:hypothetical protein